MGRVSQETIDRLAAFIESLPPEARGKCALCNETLTHIVKQAEVECGAGTATVAKVLAEKINEGAAPGDVVTAEALEKRVKRNEGKVEKDESSFLEPTATGSKLPTEWVDDSEEEEKPAPVANHMATEADQLAAIVISQLSRMRKDDPLRESALCRILKYIEEMRNN